MARSRSATSGRASCARVLTSLAIVLGVMMVAGTYVLTDTIDRSFDEIFTESNEGIDAVVTSTRGRRDRRRLGARRSRRSAARAGARGRRGRRGRGRDLRPAGRDHRRRRRARSAATARRRFGVSAGQRAASTRSTYARARKPEADDEVVIDKPTAEDAGLRDRRHGHDRRHRRRPREYTLVGTATLGDVDSFGGASIAVLTLPEAQRVTGKEGEFDQICVAAAEGVAPERARAPDRRAALPHASRPRPASRERPVPAGRHRRVHRLPEDGAADLRRRRAVRRRLPDLQHLLDHRRPAHARVRDAAHARRQPPPDHRLGGARGAR